MEQAFTIQPRQQDSARHQSQVQPKGLALLADVALAAGFPEAAMHLVEEIYALADRFALDRRIPYETQLQLA